MKKNNLSAEEILHLAKLADLKLDKKEAEKIGTQLVETLNYVKNLNELNTTKVKETNHTVNLKNEFFEDGAKNTRKLSQKEVFQNAKNKKNNYFAVKKIL